MRIEYLVTDDGPCWRVNRGVTKKLFFAGREQAVRAARNLAQGVMGQGDRAVIRVMVAGVLQEELLVEPEQLRPGSAPMRVRRSLRRHSRWPGVTFTET